MFLLDVISHYALPLVLLLLFFAVVVEGVAELICKSMIFKPLRDAVSKKHRVLRDLVHCGYCTSVWVAMLPAAFLSCVLSPSWGWWPAFFVPLTVFIHRLASRFHDFGDKHLDKFYDSRYKKDK